MIWFFRVKCGNERLRAESTEIGTQDKELRKLVSHIPSSTLYALRSSVTTLKSEEPKSYTHPYKIAILL